MPALGNLQTVLESDPYLERHRISDLLEELTSRLLAEKPDDPREFLLALVHKWKLQKLSRSRRRRYTGLIQSVVRVLDEDPTLDIKDSPLQDWAASLPE